jgi:DNA-binding response OmpR family regulator
MATVLVADDEKNILQLARMYLQAEGFTVETAGNGREALDKVKQAKPDLLVLDLMMPEIDGWEVCRRLRKESDLPIIMLTARDGEIDRILGLEMGGDDYLTKPFSPRELVARVKAILRRSGAPAPVPEVLEVGGAAIDLGRREVRAHGEVVDCTGKEFELLRYLAENRGRALSRQQILDGVWGYGWYGDARTVDVHIAQVRKKIGDAVEIKTVRGVGYVLSKDEV